MRLKDPFSLKATEMTKRTNKPRKPRDEESSDEVSGLTCQHVSKAVDLNSVKKTVLSSVWFVCSDCLKERTIIDSEPGASNDIVVCLKCGFQGCTQSGIQHAVKHHQVFHSESHCITISLSTWKAWCFECNEELSTHCNKKALAQSLDFLQRHSVKATSGASPKIIKLQDVPSDYGDLPKGKSAAVNSTLVPVKGINNLGNTCFFNAVMQNLSQTHMLIDLIQEMKEKGYKLRICPPADANLNPLTITMPSPEPLTAAMFLFLHNMKEPGKGPLNPKILFNQLCQKAPRFKGYQQQDSQELLHYLMDSIRVEEIKRVKAGILKAFNNPTERTADDDTKRQVKAYGKEGVKMNFMDRIFVGELTNTIMCEECEHISTVKEAFIDISLPIIEERISKPSNPGRLGKGSREQETFATHADVCSAAHSAANRNTRKLSGQKPQSRRSSSSLEEKAGGGVSCVDRPEEEEGVAGGSPRSTSSSKNAAASSLSDGSERDVGAQDSSNDADSEASESEWSPPPRGHAHHGHASTPPSSSSTLTPSPTPASAPSPSSPPRQGGAVEQLAMAVSRVNMGLAAGDGSPPLPPTHCPTEEREESRDNLHHQHHQGAFQALSHSYTPSSKECSIQSCLHQFTSVELLMGNNKLLCENCTERRHKLLRKGGSADRKTEKIYTSARKQMLISSLPPVIMLHLKRFHQAGMNLRKVNRHVDFPLILDLAPFCSASCKNLAAGERVLYSLYGIVEHSGSMRGGHYTAYVKVRTPQRRTDQHHKNLSGARDVGSSSQSQWVYISDTTVQTVPESRVLNSQAYLLFYEELL